MTTLDTHLPTTAPRMPVAGDPGHGYGSVRGGSRPERSGRTPLSSSRSCAVVVALTAATAAGCAVSTDVERGRQERVTATGATKKGTAELRTDLRPLLDRFPILDDPIEARWMSGRYGNRNIPGPSTYRIDAVITLPQPKVDELMSVYSPTAADETPTVVDGMREHLPAGPFLTSEAFHTAFRHDHWYASAYLHPQTNTLVLVATGT